MEFTIVLALLISGLMIWKEKQHAEAWEQQRQEILKIFNQAVWDQYGPTDAEAYQRLFPGSRRGQYQSSDDLSRFFSSLPFNQSCGFVHVPQAPSWVIQKFAGLDQFAEDLHAVLQTGPILTPPDEVEPPYLNYSMIRSHATALRFLAFRDLMQKHPEQAIEKLSDLIRLGQALRASPNPWEHVMRQEILYKGLSSFSSLIWYNIDLESSRSILETLNAFEPESWRLPSFLGSPLWSATTGRMTTQSTIAFKILNRAPQCPIDSIYKSIGIGSTDDYAVLLSYMRKWTTIPALRKRLKKLPESFYESDSFLSKEQAKKIPTLLYAATRSGGGSVEDLDFVHDTGGLEFGRLKQEALALQGAMWARKWRNEHNEWPVKEFKEQCPAGQSFSLLKINNPRPLQLGFNRLFEPNSIDSELSPISRSIKIRFPNLNTIKYTIIMSPEEQEKIEWIPAIFRVASPLVCSATYEIKELPKTLGAYGMGMGMGMMGNYGMDMGYGTMVMAHSVVEYTVELNLPKTSYWIVKYQDEILSPELYLIDILSRDDPKSRQPVVQLAGWENDSPDKNPL